MQPLALFDDHSDLQLQHIQSAREALGSLQSVDILIRLDNRHLAGHLQAEMDALAKSTKRVAFKRVDLRFARQYVILEASAALPDGAFRGREILLHGEVILLAGADGVVWQPRFFDLELAKTNGEAGAPDGAPGAELERQWLEGLNAELARNLIDRGGNSIAMDTMPLGIIEVGASETRADGTTSDAFRHLSGVFITAGSAMLIEPSTTSIALDLDLVPGVLPCPAGVTASRAGFAREINDREPVGSQRLLQPDGDINHFFTEIAGAAQPATIVHYWFADGRPASVTELEVEPSARWRTWSSRKAPHTSPRRWEVIVAEKNSGCVIASSAIQTVPELVPSSTGDRAAARQAFNNYRDDFSRKAEGFTTAPGNVGIALIEARKDFAVDVLNEVLRNLELVTYLQIGQLRPSEFEAVLEVFDASGIRCEKRECRSGRECILDYDECPVPPRDNSSCVTCLFHNPLNNRCVHEGQDPSCVQQREARNARLTRDHETCVEGLYSAHARCERLRNQEIRSCEMEADSAIGACESNRSLVESLQGGGPVAEVSGAALLAGNLRLAFSGFNYDEGFDHLRMSVGLHAEMSVSGSVAFRPGDSLASLRECIAGWHGAFTSLAFMPQNQGGLIGLTEISGSDLVTRWSGVVHPVEISPSPLEAIFVSNPGMLADCRIGLTISQVSAAISGTQRRFFNGHHELAIQPLPTRFGFLPASVKLNGKVHAGEARIGAGLLSYPIGD